MSDAGGFGGIDPQTWAIIQYLLSNPGAGATMPLSESSFGLDPTAMQMQNLTGVIPAANPDDDPLDAFAQQQNAYQDYLDIISDPAMYSMAGPGAYSADAFADTVTYEPVETPNTSLLNHYLLQFQTGTVPTLEGMIANALLVEGQSASEAIGMLTATWNAGTAPGASDEAKAAAEALRPMLAPYIFDDEGLETVNWTRVQERVLPLEQGYLSEPKPGQSGTVYGPDGEVLAEGGTYVMGTDAMGNPQLLRENREPAPEAEWFREHGLPLPTEEYTAASLMGADWQTGADIYESQVPGMDAAYQRLLDQTEAAAQAYFAGDTSGLGYDEGGAPESSTNLARTGAVGAEPVDAADVSGGPNTLGSTDVPLGTAPNIGGVDVGEEPMESGEWLVNSGLGTIQARMADAYAITDPSEFLDWYDTYGASLTDQQRADLISYAITNSYSGGSIAARQPWVEVSRLISDDLRNTQAPQAPEAPPSQEVVSTADAYSITDPTEFTTFMATHAADFDEQGIMELGQYAVEQGMNTTDPDQRQLWSTVGRQLLNGEMPTAPATIGGGEPRSKVAPGPGREPEPEPPPENYWATPLWLRDPMQMPGVAQDPNQMATGPAMGPPSRPLEEPSNATISALMRSLMDPSAQNTAINFTRDYGNLGEEPAPTPTPQQQAATEAADYWSTPPWLRDYTNLPGITMAPDYPQGGPPVGDTYDPAWLSGNGGRQAGGTVMTAVMQALLGSGPAQAPPNAGAGVNYSVQPGGPPPSSTAPTTSGAGGPPTAQPPSALPPADPVMTAIMRALLMGGGAPAQSGTPVNASPPMTAAAAGGVAGAGGGAGAAAAPANVPPQAPPTTTPSYIPSAQGAETASSAAYAQDPTTLAMIASLFNGGSTGGFNPTGVGQAAAAGGVQGGSQFDPTGVGGQAAAGGAAGAGGRERTGDKGQARLRQQAARLQEQRLDTERRRADLRRQVYGGDYQRALARENFFRRRGVTPYSVAMATRQGVPSMMGIGS